MNPTQYNGTGYGVITQLIDYVRNELRAQFNPVVGRGSTTALPYGATQTRFAIYNLTMTYEIKNTTNAVVHLQVYDAVLRPSNIVNNLELALDAWNEGSMEQLGPTGNYTQNSPLSNTMMVPTSTPFMSKKFCKFYRVFGVKSLVLHPGHTHQHTVTVRPRNTWTFEDEQRPAGTSNDWLIPGVSTCTFFALKGGVCHDRDDKSQVGFHQAAIEYVCRTKCSFGMIEKTTKLRNMFTRVGAVSNAVITTEEDVSVGQAVGTG